MTKPSALARLYSAQIQATLALNQIDKTGLLTPDEVVILNRIAADLAMLGNDIDKRTGCYGEWRKHYLPDLEIKREAAE